MTYPMIQRRDQKGIVVVRMSATTIVEPDG
jgi:hypothetical protein